MTITITIAIILFSCNAWDDYKVRYKESIRSVESENVERLRKCKTSKNGYKTYQCPKCGKKKYVPFTCKCRLCTSCGTKAANEWADEIKKTFNYDPLLCPNCSIEMELIDICFEGSDSYPTEEPSPVEPPPNIKLSQQERMQLIVALIVKNQNGSGASIEKVTSEAEKRGIDKEQLLCDFQHLKMQGEVYEPKSGEIRYVF